MDYTEKTIQLFKDLPFFNLKELAKLIDMDPNNFANHANGNRATSEKIYNKILKALEIAKNKIAEHS